MPNNLLQAIRQRNIFGTPAPENNPYRNLSFGSQDDTQQADPRSSRLDTSNVFNELMSLESGPAQQRYRSFLDEAPRREDYAPNKMSRFGAALGGISEGIRSGGARGFATARGILDEPYERAVGEYDAQGGRLAKAAELEEKNIGNRVKTFWDVTRHNADMAREDRLGLLNNKQIQNIDSQIAARDADAKTKGYQATTDMNGLRIYTRVGPNGPETINTGIKVEESPTEKRTNDFTEFGKREGLRQGNRFNFFNQTEGTRQANRKDIFDYENTARNERDDLVNVRERLEREARDASNPNREFSALSLVLRQIQQETPGSEQYMDLSTGTYKPEISERVKELMKLRGFNR